MGHQLHLDLTGPPARENLVGLRRVTLRERLARLVLGKPARFTMIVPGDSVERVTITEGSDSDDDLLALADAVGATTREGGDHS
ncbi:MAG: hypothetical protein Q4P06_08270 [Actinomycetaceae bacterium]|nr:hypothetical protein [Actinomycetaceae bacterium]